MLCIGPGIMCAKHLRSMHAFMHTLSIKYALKICKICTDAKKKKYIFVLIKLKQIEK